MSRTTGSGSYSTTMRSTASSATYRLSAATIATASPDVAHLAERERRIARRCMADDAVGVADGRNLRVGDDDGHIDESHGEGGAALDAGRAVADDPVELCAQLFDDARDAVFGEGVLVAGLRRRQK